MAVPAFDINGDLLSRFAWALGVPLTGDETEVTLTIKPNSPAIVTTVRLVDEQRIADLYALVAGAKLSAVKVTKVAP